MSRTVRSRAAIYYLVLRGVSRKDFLVSELDYAIALDVLTSLLSSTGYQLYTFCLLPNEVHLAVRMSDIPLADFMQRFASKFGLRRRDANGRSGNLVDPISKPRLIDSEDKILDLIYYLHLLPLRVGRNPEDYLWSGHRTYLNKARMACAARVALRLLDVDYKQAIKLYEARFKKALEDVRCGNGPSSGHSGGDLPLNGCSPPVRDSMPSAVSGFTSLNELFEVVANAARRDKSELHSTSHNRVNAFVRAYITWTATELRIATITEMGHFFDRDVSTLRAGITHYKLMFRQVFIEPGNLAGFVEVCAELEKGRPLRLGARVQPRHEEQPESDPVQ